MGLKLNRSLFESQFHHLLAQATLSKWYNVSQPQCPHFFKKGIIIPQREIMKMKWNIFLYLGWCMAHRRILLMGVTITQLFLSLLMFQGLDY